MNAAPLERNAGSRKTDLRNFLLIWFGQLVSGVGTRLSTFALGIWVLHETKSTLNFSIVFVAMSVPALLLLPFSGALVDRWDRRKTMMYCELASGAIMLAMAILAMRGQLQLWHVYCGAALSSLAAAFLQPAFSASVPMLTAEGDLTRVNGLNQASAAIGLLGGPLLAGALVGPIGVSGILMVDAISFLVGSLGFWMAKVPSPERGSSDEADLLKEAKEGWRYVLAHRGLFWVLVIFGINNFLFGIASVAITPLVLSIASPQVLSYQMTFAGIGLLLGSALMSVWGGPKRKIHGVLGFSVLSGMAMAVHGLAPSIVLITVFGFFLFITFPILSAANTALWQTKVPEDLQGRCFAILRIVTEGAMPLSFLLAGPLAEYVFEPAMMSGGALAGSVGAVIGVGHGRGLGLMFIAIGVAMMLVSAAGYASGSIRAIDDDSKDDASKDAQALPERNPVSAG